jgi:hypothetical protein
VTDQIQEDPERPHRRYLGLGRPDGIGSLAVTEDRKAPTLASA